MRCAYRKDIIRVLILQNTEKTGDTWFREYADVPGGDYVIGFEAIATFARQDPGIGIDDVQLLAGECQAQGKSRFLLPQCYRFHRKKFRFPTKK